MRQKLTEELKENIIENFYFMNRSYIYSTTSYSEFKMKLELIGHNNIPSKDEFDSCYPDEWKWELLCYTVVRDYTKQRFLQ